MKQAIRIRDQSYQLLLWISEAIDAGQIAASRAANHSGGPAAAADWIRNFGFVIPEHLRPADSELTEFAAFFSTFLTSSFDVVAKPGTRGAGPAGGCTCEVCMRIVNAPYLQAKKLSAGDKRRADLLMEEWLLEFAREQAVELDPATAERMVKEHSLRRAIAYLTYGHWLIKRLYGESDGPAILALWRLIAWDPRGGAIRGFELQVADFVRAERSVLIALCQHEAEE